MFLNYYPDFDFIHIIQLILYDIVLNMIICIIHHIFLKCIEKKNDIHFLIKLLLLNAI